MRVREITGAELPPVAEIVEEIATEVMDEGTISPVKPMTPAQMRTRKAKEDKAAAAVADTKAANAIKLRKAQRRLSDV